MEHLTPHQKPGHRTLLSQVATHLRIGKVCRTLCLGRGRTLSTTIRRATIEPTRLLAYQKSKPRCTGTPIFDLRKARSLYLSHCLQAGIII